MADLKPIINPPDVPSPGPAAPAANAPISITPTASLWYALPGFAILVVCLLLGDELKVRCALILPGNILGMFILLTLLALGVVPLRWVEEAARCLLWLLPLLFVPIFVLALKDKAFWATRGPVLIAIMFVATLGLWAFAGHLAQWLLARERK